MKIHDRAVVGADCETHLTRRGLALPPMVCLSLYAEHEIALEAIDEHTSAFADDPEHYLVGEAEAGVWWLLSAHAARLCWPAIIADDRLHIAAHNAPYDLGILAKETDDVEAVFSRLEVGSISDTMIRERLAAIAAGHLGYDPDLRMKDPRHSLAQVVKKRLDVDISGDKMRTPKAHKHDPWEWVKVKLKCPDCDLEPWLGIGHPNDPDIDSEGRITKGRHCSTCDGFGLSGPWRLRYCQLHGVPLNRWPERAVNYAIDDPMWTHLALEAQLDVPVPTDTGEPIVDEGGLFVDEVNQMRSWWALSLMAVWGMRTEPHRVANVVGDWTERANKAIKVGTAAGFVRADGSEDRAAMCRLVAEAYTAKGEIVPRGKPTTKMLEKALKFEGIDSNDPRIAELRAGNIKYSDAVLSVSGNAALESYSEGKVYRSHLSKYAGTLQIGTTRAITSRPNPLVVTGRCGWTDPPLHQPPKKGGYRECHVPRPGWLYVSADYDTVEICSLAQQHIDWELGTTLRDKIAEGIDLHVDLAVDVYGIPYDELMQRIADGDEEADDMRFTCKAGNFGFMGGMGAKTCVATYGIKTFSKRGDLDEAITEAKRVQAIWLAKTPENKGYFDIISRALDGTGRATAIQAVSGRQRLCELFTQMANTYFQGRTADGAKLGTWLLAKACYVRNVDPRLYGVRPWLMLHDELFASMRRDMVQLGAPAMVGVLKEAMQVVTPDVPVGIDPSLMRRWYKGAKPIEIDGLLLPWEPWKRQRHEPLMYVWNADNLEQGRAVAYADGSWRAYRGAGAVMFGEGKVERHEHESQPAILLAVAKHRAECCVLGEVPWV